MSFFRYLRHAPKPSRGIFFDQASAIWAETRFPVDLRPTAACVVKILCERVSLKLSELEPQKRCVEDLRIDEETVEVVMTFEEVFGITIPDDDACLLGTLGEIVEYLHERTRLSAGSAVESS